MEMVGRHEKWTGHNENKVGENRGRAYGAQVGSLPSEDLIINLGGILSPRSTCLSDVKVSIVPGLLQRLTAA